MVAPSSLASHALKHLGKALSVENIVAQDQRHVVVADEFFTDDERRLPVLCGLS